MFESDSSFCSGASKIKAFFTVYFFSSLCYPLPWKNLGLLDYLIVHSALQPKDMKLMVCVPVKNDSNSLSNIAFQQSVQRKPHLAQCPINWNNCEHWSLPIMVMSTTKCLDRNHDCLAILKTPLGTRPNFSFLRCIWKSHNIVIE